MFKAIDVQLWAVAVYAVLLAEWKAIHRRWLVHPGGSFGPDTDSPEAWRRLRDAVDHAATVGLDLPMPDLAAMP